MEDGYGWASSIQHRGDISCTCCCTIKSDCTICVDGLGTVVDHLPGIGNYCTSILKTQPSSNWLRECLSSKEKERCHQDREKEFFHSNPPYEINTFATPLVAATALIILRFLQFVHPLIKLESVGLSSNPKLASPVSVEVVGSLPSQRHLI